MHISIICRYRWPQEIDRLIVLPALPLNFAALITLCFFTRLAGILFYSFSLCPLQCPCKNHSMLQYKL